MLHTVNMSVVFVGLVIFKCFCHSWNLNKFLMNAAHVLVLLLVSNRHLWIFYVTFSLSGCAVASILKM